MLRARAYIQMTLWGTEIAEGEKFMTGVRKTVEKRKDKPLNVSPILNKLQKNKQTSMLFKIQSLNRGLRE